MGLPIVLALVVGVASAAFGASGGNFFLGRLNKATAIPPGNYSLPGFSTSVSPRSSKAVFMPSEVVRATLEGGGTSQGAGERSSAFPR